MNATTSKDLDINIYEYVKEEDGFVSKSSFLEILENKGILKDDPRIGDFIKSTQNQDDLLNKDVFLSGIKNTDIIANALSHATVIPDFEEFYNEVKLIFDESLRNIEGKVNDLLPLLPNHNQEHFGVSICTIDGQRLNIGDTMIDFCLQSCCKPINYCLAANEHGKDKIYKHVGREPSGIASNALILDRKGLPHNPLINSGGIMMCSLIKNDFSEEKRFEYILDMWKKLTGGTPIGYSTDVYQSERVTSYRNFAMAYILEENKAFPEKANLTNILENYFRCHSLTIKSNYLSIVAATLANGGVCPLTNEKIFESDIVKNCLSTMYSCGMYDYSGEFAFKIGLPASSSGTGALFVVIPKVMGICVYSPRLDEYGNSVRGVDFFTRLTNLYNFHMFDMAAISKYNPTKDDLGDMTVTKIIKCSSIGDLSELKRLDASEEQLMTGDYDRRSPLHLAASNGHLSILLYILVKVGVNNVNPVDRWGGTPYDDALREKHHEIVQYLQSIGGKKGADLLNH